MTLNAKMAKLLQALTEKTKAGKSCWTFAPDDTGEIRTEVHPGIVGLGGVGTGPAVHVVLRDARGYIKVSHTAYADSAHHRVAGELLVLATRQAETNREALLDAMLDALKPKPE